jgi:hypothetical protein
MSKKANLASALSNVFDGCNNFTDNLIIDLEIGRIIAEDGLISEYALIPGLDEEDAKLTTKQRKNLKSSVFCGPNRSFPVPDCAHVTAAKRLIGKYKGPGSKSAILACVNRRAKELGCDGKKDSFDNPDLKDSINESVSKHLSVLFPENQDTNIAGFVEAVITDLHITLAEMGQYSTIALDELPDAIEDTLSRIGYLKKENKESLLDVISTVIYSAVLTVVDIGGDGNEEDA